MKGNFVPHNTFCVSGHCHSATAIRGRRVLLSVVVSLTLYTRAEGRAKTSGAVMFVEPSCPATSAAPVTRLNQTTGRWYSMKLCENTPAVRSAVAVPVAKSKSKLGASPVAIRLHSATLSRMAKTPQQVRKCTNLLWFDLAYAPDCCTVRRDASPTRGLGIRQPSR